MWTRWTRPLRHGVCHRSFACFLDGDFRLCWSGLRTGVDGLAADAVVEDKDFGGSGAWLLSACAHTRDASTYAVFNSFSVSG
jgi:hypothetical protein